MPKHGQLGALIQTPKGNLISRDPARVVFAADQLRTKTYSLARRAIMAQWGVSRATAERDIAAAKQLIALELDGMEVRAGETRRNERIADRAERLAAKAAKVQDWTAAAALQRSAIAASREVSRLTGAYAPKEIKLSTGQAPELPLQLDAILGILDEEGRAAFRIVQQQIEAAKADGRLQLPAPADAEPEADAAPAAEDAEFVDRPGEN